jgi:choice-of-anchor B domain-containing protein
MIKRNVLAVLLLSVGVSSLMTTDALAHTDDPKVFDRIPRWEGPSYRRALDPRGTTRGTFDSVNIVLEAQVSLTEFNSAQGSDCWGYTAPSGREYAIMGLRAATSFVEVTNPANPQIIATHSGGDSLWRDVKVFGHHAYSVNETSGGIQIFDMSQIDSGTVTPLTSVTSGGVSSTHNVAVDEESGYLYRLGGGNNLGLRIYDLNSNPASPNFVGQWTDRYVHDAQIVVWDSGPHAGKQIAVCCSGGNNGSVDTGLELLDVTNKGSITQLGRIIYPNGAYSHQVWISPDQQYAYVNDELDEPGLPSTTLVFDISDPTDPILVNTFTNGRAAITHNNYLKDGYLFVANYTDGVRIFDLADPVQGVEVAYFDTRPESSAATFNGLWSVYPYFESGTIIGSDFERGLFVWSANLPEVLITYPNGLVTETDPNGGTVLTVDINGRLGGSITPGSEQLFVDTGSGFTQVPLTALGSGSFEAALPGAGCGVEVRYYVTATDSNAIAAYSPANAPASWHTAFASEGAQSVNIFADQMESDTGWTAGEPGDTATTGVWERVDPVASGAQPEDDYSDPGTICWITGQQPGGGNIGTNDVDGGFTTLTSPLLDASADTDGTAVISFALWYSNSLGTGETDDTFDIDISNNDGASWVVLDNIASSTGIWRIQEYRVADALPPTSQMRLRFTAHDFVPNSIVEAGIDDLDVSFVVCTPPAGCEGDANGDNTVDVNDISYVLFRLGDAGPIGTVEGDANLDGIVDVNDISYVLFRLGPCA